MRIPALGPRGEGWVLAQSALFVGIAASAIAGPGWPASATSVRLVAGIAIGVAGVVLFVAAAAGLGHSLSPYPRPSRDATLRTGGVYRLVRHPIYGGVILIALGSSLVWSPLALLPTALLLVLFELKSRREESMLLERFSGYETYRRRVRWRFVPGLH